MRTILACVLFLAACHHETSSAGGSASASAEPSFASRTQTPAAPAGAELKVTSAAFEDGQEIPRDFTCEGAGDSPPLSWAGAPAGTRSFAVIVDDPDAPDPAKP